MYNYYNTILENRNRIWYFYTNILPVFMFYEIMQRDLGNTKIIDNLAAFANIYNIQKQRPGAETRSI